MAMSILPLMLLGSSGSFLKNVNVPERLSNRAASGLSIVEFCVDEGVSRSTFYRWVDRLKDGIPDAVKEDKTLTLADIAEPKFLPVSVTASPVEIELPNGGLVRLPVGVGHAVIVEVIQAVTGLQTRRKPLS